MKGIVLLSIVLAVCAVTVLATGDAERDQYMQFLQTAKADPNAAFNSWMNEQHKDYANSVEDVEKRYTIWLDNLEYILDYNEKHTSHWLGLNSLADWSHAEYRQYALGYRAELQNNNRRATNFSHATTVAPKSVDWRTKQAVSEVKNQMQCGSCWAFSTTGSVEGANALFSGELVSLSEQELVDCDTARDHGCRGGLMDFAFQFIIQNGGLDTEEDYKYRAAEGQCQVDKQNRHVVTIDDFEDVPQNDEKALEKAVANQPVSVAIEADQRPFQLYRGGIFDAPCGLALDHGVLIVGYGTGKNATDGSPEDYWIVKNSWGALWGDHGYIKLVKNTTSVQGQCGIAMQASYPIKKTPNPPPSPPSPPTPPAPPAPKPVDCDASTQCPAGSTCCCMKEYFGFCFTWACCPMVKATCCDDHLHCCPHNLPVCDTAAGRCLAQAGQGYPTSVAWSEKMPAQKKSSVGRFSGFHLPAHVLHQVNQVQQQVHAAEDTMEQTVRDVEANVEAGLKRAADSAVPHKAVA